jgi:hypothetical protein
MRRMVVGSSHGWFLGELDVKAGKRKRGYVFSVIKRIRTKMCVL